MFNGGSISRISAEGNQIYESLNILKNLPPVSSCSGNNEGDTIRAKAEINAIPFHLGANDNNASENHRLCPRVKNTGVTTKVLFLTNLLRLTTLTVSKALIEHVGRIFSEYRYNDGEFIKTLSFGMTTNHNESIHNLLFSDP